jgi:hypothetical protein
MRSPRAFGSLLVFAIVVVGAESSPAFGQGGFQPFAGGIAVGGGQAMQGQMQGNVQGQMQGNVQGGVAGAVAGGIDIDAQGVVTPSFSKGKAGKLNEQQLAAFAKQHVNADVNVPSDLRKVSLVRLEQAIEECLKTNQPVPPEMQFLAGLWRIDFDESVGPGGRCFDAASAASSR